MNLMEMAAILAMGTTDPRALEEPRRIVISIADRKLVLIEQGRIQRIYDVAVGTDRTPSPSGAFKIVNRVQQPTWFGPKQTVPPGPSNPLGPRWMGLGYRGYGIHGTNAPKSIGKAASHGCFRMRNADVQELFEKVSVGDPVTIVRQLTPLTAGILAGNEPAVTASGGQ